MKVKRSLLMLLAIGLGLSLASCHRGNGDKTIIKIGFWPEKTETYDLGMYNTWKEKFETDFPEYSIVGDPYTYSTDTIGSKFMTGSLPTIFQTWFTEPEKLVNKKYIRSIDKELKELGWDKMMDSDMREALTFDDKIYGVPRDGYGLGLLINIQTLGDNGLLPEDEHGNYVIYNKDGSPAYPTSFEEIYEASKTIQEYDETKGILICSTNKNGGWQFSNIAWNFGAELQHKDASGKWVSTLDDVKAVEALKWIQKMKQEELLLNSVSVAYDDWYNAIESKVAMAIVGSDVLHLAQVNGNVSMDNLAFVPMPTGDNEHRYSLYGGVPYVFNASATDEQVKGALLFLEYIGRSPLIHDISKAAMVQGNEVSKNKNQPILPKIKPWINQEYVEYANSLEEQYVSVKKENYEEFFTKISKNKHKEVEKGAQEMYEYLDTVIQSVFKDPFVANPQTLLQTANSKMQDYLNKNVNK